LDSSAVGIHLSSLAGYNLDAAIQSARKMEFQSVGIAAFAGSRGPQGEIPGFWFDDMTEEEVDHLKRALRRFERIVIQAPWEDVPLFTYNRGVQREALRQVYFSIEAAWMLGARLVTVRANPKRGFELKEYWSEMAQVFREIGDFADGCSLRVAVETGFPDRYREYTQLFLEIDHEAVGAAIHIGELGGYLPADQRSDGASYYNDLALSLFQMLGSKVFHVRLSDASSPEWEGGQEVGTGVVRLPPVLEFLEGIHYEGGLELSLRDRDAEKALRASRARVEMMIQNL
jgi:sugar phosphate isomerase/epimerase